MIEGPGIEIEAVHRDPVGSRMGMWLFLFTEFFLFVVLFIIFFVYRSRYPEDFHHASGNLSVLIATANTLILLTSSFFMATSVWAIRVGKKHLAILALLATIFLAIVFLVNKYIEWSEKIGHGIYPGATGMKDLLKGEGLFYNLYFIMTGLHGLHVAGGIILLSVMVVFVVRDKIVMKDFAILENSGLYWHLIDIIWIYLFSFFYLVT
ncbi:MAG: cytochrome c oxidase subunit 3 [Nitrospirae bacterium]|nr:cytochrome c oxidase subunit 3 [Nitrospirota bacterium]